jgi:uncharacterized protein YprB with RNaseH-like and TPR domain
LKDPIYLDIETTSLDADSGIIVAIGYARGNTKPKIMFLKKHDYEQKMINDIFEIINEKTVITFNGNLFDIPFLIARSLKYDILIPHINTLDLYAWSKKYLRLQSRRFHEICMFLNIEHEEISGKEVNELFIKAISGNNSAKQRIINHLNQDIKALQLFHLKIKPLLKNYPSPDWMNK